MELVEVKSKEQVRAFLKLPVSLYWKEPSWIRPLDKDVEAVFNPKKNKSFDHGVCCRWILKDDQGKVIGRVAAFIDDETKHKGNDQPTGGMGFFDCINDRDAAFVLFDQCKKWLADRGMEAMDGPINFGSRDRWWGLLVGGFDREPNYQVNFNFPYYQQFFEEYGFQPYFFQYTYGRPIVGALSSRMEAKARLVSRTKEYRFGYPEKLNLNKIAGEIVEVYNKAWSNRKEMPELTFKQAHHLLHQMKPILDKRLIWFGYFNDEPIAFFISIPEVNQIYKHLNGRFGLLAKLKAFWLIKRKTSRKAFGVLFGIVPKHQGKGIDGGIIVAFRDVVHHSYRRYDTYELGWIGDFNPKMMKVAEQIEADIVKTHITYRKLFDPSKPFNRMPILN